MTEEIISTLNNILKFSDGVFVQKYPKNCYAQFDYLTKYLGVLKDLKENTVKRDENSKIVWQCWLQGEENMPELVKACTDSVKKYNSKYVLITNENVEQYIPVPDYIKEKFLSGIIPAAQYSDIIRLMLLKKYGGVWLDSTIYETDKLPKEAYESEFFTLRNHAGLCFDKIKTFKDLEIMSNYFNRPIMLPSSWFISSSPENIIINGWLKLLLEYWKNENSLTDYFIMDYFFVLLLLSNDICRKIFESIPTILTTSAEVLQSAMPEEYDEELFERIKTYSPIHKLTLKYTPDSSIQNRFYHKIVAQNV